MRGSRPGAILLLVVAIVAVLAHVCTPVGGHAHAASPGDAHHHHHGGEPHDTPDSFHAASCEALRPAVIQAPIAAQAAVPLAVPVATPQRTNVTIPDLTVLVHSPPLYLQHAALLI